MKKRFPIDRLPLSGSLLALSLLQQACVLQPTREPMQAQAPSAADSPHVKATDALASQPVALYKASAAAGLSGELVIVEVPAANNGISNALSALWGMDGTPASDAIGRMLSSGKTHFGVSGASPRINVAATEAALKASRQVRRPVQVFVFAGDDAAPARLALPEGIQVHWVRADGSLWP